jgi:hypothetical protein
MTRERREWAGADDEGNRRERADDDGEQLERLDDDVV